MDFRIIETDERIDGTEFVTRLPDQPEDWR